jgi:hypothetical protein
MPPHRGEAKEAGAEQRDRRRLGYEFGNHHLAVAGLEIGDQDLVDPRVQGPATTTGTISTWAAITTRTAAVAATTAAGKTIATAAAEAAAKVATGEIWKRTTALTAERSRIATSGEKATTTTAAEESVAGTTVAAGAPAEATPVRASETALAWGTAPPHIAATAAATGND